MMYLKPSLLIVTGVLALLPAVGCSGRNARSHSRPVRTYRQPVYASPHTYQPQYETTPIAPQQLPSQSYDTIEPHPAPPADGMLPAPDDYSPAPGDPHTLPPMPDSGPMPTGPGPGPMVPGDGSTYRKSRPGLLPSMTRRVRGMFSRDQEPTAQHYQNPTMQNWPTPAPVSTTSQPQGPALLPPQEPNRWSNAPSA